jgi:hypothetical protein
VYRFSFIKIQSSHIVHNSILIHIGFIFGNILTCHFGYQSVVGVFISPSQISCIAPTLHASNLVPFEGDGLLGSVLFSVSMNKIPGISSLIYVYLNEPIAIVINPSNNTYAYEDQVKNTTLNTTSPLLNITPNITLYSNPTIIPVVEIISPILITIVPDYGGIIGGTTLVIYGVSFESYKSATCLFGNISMPALILNGTAIECVTPSVPLTGTVQLGLTFDGVYISTDLIFTYVNRAIINNFSPIYGSTYGGTELIIRGSGFYEDNIIICNFGFIGSYNAIFISDTELVCITPSYYTGGSVLVTLSGILFYIYVYIYVYTCIYKFVNIYIYIYLFILMHACM